MRRLVGATVLLAVVAGCGWGVASAAPLGREATPELVVVPNPSFPPPLARFTPLPAPRFELVSTTRRDPALFPDRAYVVTLPAAAPKMLAGGRPSEPFTQPGTTLILYGTGVIAGFGPRGHMKYAFDLRSFGFPPKSLVPRAYGPQEIVWARQVGRLLIVQASHLGYAKDSGNRNGYLTGIDINTGKVRWRSPSLVANARNFVVTRGLIVSGYGFTAERDWLYLVDPRTGRVRDRLALRSMAEQIAVRGEKIVVRCYDAHVVVQLSD